MAKVNYIRKGFTDESLEIIEKVKQAVQRYDEEFIGKDYVKEQMAKQTHSKYSDTNILTKILIEGGRYVIEKMEKEIMERKLRETRGNGKSEIRKQMLENYERNTGEEPPQPDIFVEALRNPEVFGMVSKMGCVQGFRR